MLQGFPARILILCSQVSPPDLLPDFPARIELLCSQDSPPEILILCSQDCPPELLPDFPARNVRIYVVVSPCLSFGIVYPLGVTMEFCKCKYLLKHCSYNSCVNIIAHIQ